MATISNVPTNGRSLNGIISLTDGIAVLENGDLNCNDINSDSINTASITTGIFTCNGEFRSNLVGPYTISTSVSAEKGSLISYGNVSNSGATDFTNYGSTYNLLKQGFYFNNINSTQPLTNLAIIDNSQTYFKSQLVGCTAESPLNTTSIVNKSYVDDNFVDKTTNQSINGLKLFLNKLEVYNTASNASLTLRVSSGTAQQSTISQNGSSLQFLNNSTTPTITYLISGANRLTVSPTQFLLDASCFLTTNDIKSRLPTGTHSLLNDITTGSLTISSTTASNTINGSTSFSSIPLCSINATTANQLVNFTTLNAQGFTTLPLVQANNNVWTGTNTFNTNLPTSTLTPSSGTQLITKSYADGSFLDFVTDQTINATNKRFNGLFCTGLSITPTVGGAGNRQQIYITGNELTFNPLFNSNYYRFYCRDSLANSTYPLEISSTSTIIRNLATFYNQIYIYDIGGGSTYSKFVTGPLGVNYSAVNSSGTTTRHQFYTTPDGITEISTVLIENTATTIQNNLISNGQATFNNGAVFNTSLPTSTLVPNNQYQLVNKNYVDGMPVHQILNTNNIWTGTNTYNTYLPTSTITPSSGTQLVTKNYTDGAFVNLTTAQSISGNKYFANRVQLYGGIALDVGPGSSTFAGNIDFNSNTYFVNSPPICYIQPSIGSHLTRKDYIDGNFMYKTGNINENITGEKTFQSNTIFTGSNGYFMINPNMSSGSLNPASEAGTIGIIGLKDQVNDNFLLTLYGSIHASVKLNFSSGVSMGFGGGASPNTQVLCNGTNIVIKPSLQFSGDSTIQNSAYTGAGGLNGTYNLANMTIDTNGKITSLTSGLSSNNIWTGTNTFNTILPTTSIQATSANELVNFTTLNAQSFVKATSNTTFSGFNTFSNGLTIKSTLDLKDTSNTQSGIIDMGGGGILLISSNNNSGKVQINTYDSGGSSYNRLIIDENECNLTVPITLNLDYTYYNPFNFTSTRLGYITSNTGSANTLTSGTGSNSGQLNLPAGSWNICYTATVTVITNTLTTLNSLEVFLADSFNADLNIIGLDVLNYYKISTISIGQKFKISASGNLTSYSNTNTQYNLRLIPNFVAGSGGLNFQGSISATRNA